MVHLGWSCFWGGVSITELEEGRMEKRLVVVAVLIVVVVDVSNEISLIMHCSRKGQMYSRLF